MLEDGFVVRTWVWGVMLATVLAALPAGMARAALDFDEGAWRLELRGMGGIHQGGRDRTGDTMFLLGAEYEVPATRHGTLGLRLLPLFIYDSDEKTDPILGVGFGLAGRLYARGERYQGLFVETELNALFHEDRIPANSSNLNFLTGLGVGYQFGDHVSAALRYQHISNASLGNLNAGANAVGLSLAFRF